jgi:hypothetical protein
VYWHHTSKKGAYANLILIHPINLTVRICPSLSNREYQQYNGIKIKNRSDGERPDLNLLKEKWNWTNWLPKAERIP